MAGSEDLVTTISVPPVPGNIIQGRSKTHNLLIDYETGGIGLNDPSQGQLVQVWQGIVQNFRDIYFSAPNTPNTIVYSTGYAAQMISICFDQNMRPHVAFMENGTSKLYFYNSSLGHSDLLVLPTGSKNPKITLNDKRPEQSTYSDIVLVYQRGTDLFVRVQRERYLIEHLVATGTVGELLKIGMNDGMRIQYEFGVKMTDKELMDALAQGSPIASSEIVTPDSSTSPSSSDIWELERKE
jgi:hypothetical protein